MSERDNYVETVRAYYNDGAAHEWERLGAHSPEFELTRRFIMRYIKPGERVLDVGGGPGRYSLYLAREGCRVTLVDLSEVNVALALEKAAGEGLALTAFQGDARYVDGLVDGPFDHVLLMGPLYHLLTKEDRTLAVEAAMKALKPGGLLYASFISMAAGMIYMMKNDPALLASNPIEVEFMNLFIEDKPFAGQAFTQAYFERWQDISPFMEQIGLQKLHLFGQEGLFAPCEHTLLAQPPEVVAKWLDLSEKVCEREELLCFAEHHMYIGRKPVA